MDLLETGAPAPTFRLMSDSGSSVSLGDLRGRWVVLYFYPRDNTPGCTRQAKDFGDALATLEDLGAAVIGVSKDGRESHCAFRDKFKIRFPLLSDVDLETHRAYGVWGTKVLYGRKMQGTIRSTFLISPTGRIASVWRGVRVNGHAEAVVDALRAHREQAPKKKRS